MIETPFGNIPGKRVITNLGSRHEPVTYWFAMGDRAVTSGWEKRVVELRFGLTGQVPDGLLFRVSSISSDAITAFSVHERFVSDLLASVPKDTRLRVSGLGS